MGLTGNTDCAPPVRTSSFDSSSQGHERKATFSSPPSYQIVSQIFVEKGQNPSFVLGHFGGFLGILGGSKSPLPSLYCWEVGWPTGICDSLLGFILGPLTLSLDTIIRVCLHGPPLVDEAECQVKVYKLLRSSCYDSLF